MPSKSQREQPSALLAVTCALVVAGCGGTSRDGAEGPAPGPDSVVGEPALELPPAGELVDGIPSLAVKHLAVDETGIVWAATCGGLFAVNGTEIRRYPVDGPPFFGSIQVLRVDAQNRKWLSVQREDARFAVLVLERGAWREIAEGEFLTLVGVAQNGVAWLAHPDTRAFGFPARTLERVTRTVSESASLTEDLRTEITPPEALDEPTTDAQGALWARSSESRRWYRWLDGAWQPLEGKLGEVSSLRYDPRQNVLFGFGDGELIIVDGPLPGEERRFPEPEHGDFVGFDADGRQLWKDNKELLRVEDGEVVRRTEVFSSVLPHVLGPGGRFYQAETFDGIYTESAAGEMVLVAPYVSSSTETCSN